MKTILGLDIGGTKILGILYDEKGRELAREKKKTKANEGLEVVINQVYKVIDNLMAYEKSELTAIGAGVPGLVSDEGTIAFSPNIPFRDFALGKKLSEKYTVPVYVGNDVNVAMFGEYKHLEHRASKHVLGIFIGTGVGGAIIIDGKLYTGQGSAGEFGHMVVSADGAYCGCGAQGCLEAYASKTAIQKYISKQLVKGRKSMFKELLEEDGAVLKSSSIRKAFDEEDELAKEVVDRLSRYMGIAVGNLINLYHPELIIIGGGITEALGDILLDKIISESRQHAMPGLLGTVKFNVSELADEAGVFGAYHLAKNML